MEILDSIPTKAVVNPFTSDVAQLAEVTDSNPNAGARFEWPAKELGKNKFKLSAAAREIGRTASYADIVENGDKVSVTVRLKPLHKSLSGAERLARREEIKAAKAAEAQAAKPTKPTK